MCAIRGLCRVQPERGMPGLRVLYGRWRWQTISNSGKCSDGSPMVIGLLSVHMPSVLFREDWRERNASRMPLEHMRKYALLVDCFESRSHSILTQVVKRARYSQSLRKGPWRC